MRLWRAVPFGGLNACLHARVTRGARTPRRLRDGVSLNAPGALLVPPRRLRGLRWTEVAGRRVPIAESPVTRLLGLALLDRDRAGPGLLIPRCRSVHTLGMRFALDVLFVDAEGQVVSGRRAIPPGRIVVDRGAAAVLELPA